MVLDPRQIFERLIAVCPDLIYAYDLRERRIEHVAGGLRPILGYEDEQVLGKSLLALVHPDDRDRAEAMLARHVGLRDGEPSSAELRFVHADGRPRWLRLSETVLDRRPDGTPWRIVGRGIDLSADREREAELVRSEERFRLATRAMPGLVYDWDIDSGQTWRSPGLADMVGYSPEEVPETREWWTDRIDAEDRASLARMTPGDRSVTNEYRVRHRDGSWRTVRDHARLVWDGERLVRVVGSTVDVTDLRRAEQDAKQALARAEEAARAKDRFFAVLGHELRNPLAPIVTALHVLRRKQQWSRELDVIERQTAYLSRLVDDLLDVARVTQGRLELRRSPVELSDVIRRGLEIASPHLEAARQHVVVDGLDDAMVVDGDATRLVQVVVNLLTNAARYSERDRTVTVTARRVDGQLEVEVCDQGEGIDPPNLARIFDPFVQEETSRRSGSSGPGLGLAIARSIAQLHGGALRAHSDGKGRGSTFVLALPEHPHPPARRARTSSSQENRAPGQRVLLVDDNEDAVMLLAEALQGYGFTVETALDAPAALEAVRRAAPDAAVLDLGLPVIDGLELARMIRSMPGMEELRLFALTGYGAEEDRARTTEAGFERHFTKPVEADRIAAALIEISD